MITISLCMIVKNEQENLSRCLECIKDIMDEIIIVDTGSTDQTKEIARTYTTKVYDFIWENDFSAARNYSFSKATQQYIMWLDADDILLDEDIKKLIRLKEIMNDSSDVVIMKYNLTFDNKGNVMSSIYRERLLKNKKFIWEGKVHEYIRFHGNILTVDICITHNKTHFIHDRNLTIYENMITKGDTLSPRDTYYYARELFNNGLLNEAEKYYNKYLDTGFNHKSYNLTSYLDLAQCYFIKKDFKKALKLLLRSLECDIPSGEICSYIGFCFKKLDHYEIAIHWFETALNLPKPKKSWSIIYHEYWDYVPYIMLCTCYYQIENFNKAKEYNTKALMLKPNDPRAIELKKILDIELNKMPIDC